MVRTFSFLEKKKFPRSRKNKIGQLKIQQMAFMLVAVFVFFILVGLFWVRWQSKDISGSLGQLQKEQAISSLAVISDMTELNCDSRKSFCVDEDKLKAFTKKDDYDNLWPVASVKVYKLDGEEFVVYDSGQTNKKEYSTYVSVCKKMGGWAGQSKCEIGKLAVGVVILEDEDE